MLAQLVAQGAELLFLLIGEAGGLLLRVNPIAFVISSARNSLLYAETPDAAALGAWFAIAALLCFAGIKISYAYENTYVKII